MAGLALMNVHFMSIDTEEIIDTFPARHPRRINVKNIPARGRTQSSQLIMYEHA